MALTGCYSPRRHQLAAYDDLSTMLPDCTNARIQIRHLEAQLKHGGYNPERSDRERRYVQQAKDMIWTLRSQCLERQFVD